MLSDLLTKSLRDRAVASLLAAVLLVGLVWFYMGIYSGLAGEFTTLLQQMPDAVAALYGSNDGTTAGLVTSAVFSIIAPAILLVYAISGGTGAAVGEERGRTLELLLMNPVSRSRVLLTKCLVLVLGIVVISALLWAGAELSAAVSGMDVSGQRIAAASVQLAGLSLMFAALALAIGAWTGRGIGTAVAGGLAAVSYLATTMLSVVPSLADLARFTPWYLYTGGEPLQNGVDVPALVAMLLIAAGLTAAAVVGFRRRDLRG